MGFLDTSHVRQSPWSDSLPTVLPGLPSASSFSHLPCSSAAGIGLRSPSPRPIRRLPLILLFTTISHGLLPPHLPPFNHRGLQACTAGTAAHLKPRAQTSVFPCTPCHPHRTLCHPTPSSPLAFLLTLQLSDAGSRPPSQLYLCLDHPPNPPASELQRAFSKLLF